VATGEFCSSDEDGIAEEAVVVLDSCDKIGANGVPGCRVKLEAQQLESIPQQKM
jgi:hypothetical protein